MPNALNLYIDVVGRSGVVVLTDLPQYVWLLSVRPDRAARTVIAALFVTSLPTCDVFARCT